MARYGFQIKKRKSGKKVLAFLFFTFFLVLISLSIYKIDRDLVPSILALSDIKMTTRINSAINSAVQRIMVNKYSAEDFYTKTTDEYGKVNSLAVNTVLVNDICASAALEISTELQNIGAEKLSLPIGSISGISFLANLGPDYSVTIYPAGNATVDYNSKFEAAGINQINFQIWLKVKSTVRIVNPIQHEQLIVTRDISLVNTIITGEIPKAFLGQ